MVEYTATLPRLHSGQVRAFNAAGRFTALRCGRRWGKTKLLTTIACDGAIKGEPIGIFAPEYKFLPETYQEISDILGKLVSHSNRNEGVIRLKTGGRIDFWSLENERAGRSRFYKKALIDEAAFTKTKVMMRIWEQSIKPTLLDLAGEAWAFSNTNGIDQDNFFWQICNDPKYNFTQFHAPTHSNPHLPKSELRKLKKENHPLVYLQEYEAEFVDWSGVAFFSRDNLLVNGEPFRPSRLDGVYAIIDTATKTGLEHDTTAVTFFGINKFDPNAPPLFILDWDVVQIEGAFLETWLPNVFRRLEELAREYDARLGVLGTWIEDKSSGTILLQQVKNKELPAQPIDSVLTSLGKDERAINVSGYVYTNKVKITPHAFNKISTLKGQSRNHFLVQILGYRVGQKNKADDILDTFTYGIALGLGNIGGF